jgi:hypothetical protein
VLGLGCLQPGSLCLFSNPLNILRWSNVLHQNGRDRGTSDNKNGKARVEGRLTFSTA